MLVPVRVASATLLLGAFACLALGAADVAAFNWRAASLEHGWSADEASGVTAQQLAPARASLQSLRNRRLTFLPYSAFSGALLRDPFGAAEDLAAHGRSQALTAARGRALDDLTRLKDAGGPNYDGLETHTAELGAATRVSDYLRLAGKWEAEASQLGDVRAQLAQASGGLTDKLPKDIVDGVGRLQSVISAASQSKVSTDPAGKALTDAQFYLKLGYPAQLEQHSSLASEVQAAGDTVQHRLDTRAQTDALLGELSNLLGQASRYGVTGSVVDAAHQGRADAQAAESSADDGKMDAAAADLKHDVDALAAAVAAARQQSSLQSYTTCIEGAPVQEIVIHLATQQLVAYDSGCPFMTTLVTTGRPALPTDRGTFHIFAKYPAYHMISPWPPGSLFWYHDAWVYDAMEFVSDGTFIHNASWQPAGTYGPGSQYGPYASHGCVHVADAPLAKLYAWAQIGTTVVVTD